MAAFTAAIFLTKVGHSYASSPFIGFITFLLISAMTRWGQRSVMLTGLALVLACALTGGVFDELGRTIDGYQHNRRLITMIGLSVMIYLFGTDMRVIRLASIPDAGDIPGERRTQIMAGALAYAPEALNARGVAIAVTGPEEPWVDLYRNSDGQFTHERLGPSALNEDFGPDAAAALFDIPRAPASSLVPMTGSNWCVGALALLWPIYAWWRPGSWHASLQPAVRASCWSGACRTRVSMICQSPPGWRERLARRSITRKWRCWRSRLR